MLPKKKKKDEEKAVPFDVEKFKKLLKEPPKIDGTEPKKPFCPTCVPACCACMGGVLPSGRLCPCHCHQPIK